MKNSENKMYTMCLTCGMVQVRTDIDYEIDNKYILLPISVRCPKCNKLAASIGTRDIKAVKKSLKNGEEIAKNDHRVKMFLLRK